jgi:xylulokinase
LGAALYAGVGVGIYKDCRDAAAKAVRLGASYEPNPAVYSAYDEAYERHTAIYKNLAKGGVC